MTKPYFEAAFDMLDDEVCIITDDRTIIKTNKTIKEKYSKSEGQLRGKKCYREFFGRDLPCDHCPLEESKKTLKSVTKEVLENYLLTVSPIFNGDPYVPLGFVHILKNISKVNKQKEEIKILKESKKNIRIGELLVDEKKITLNELQIALKIRNKKIGEILVDGGYIDNIALEILLEKQKELNS